MTDEELLVSANKALSFNLSTKFRMISLDVNEANNFVDILVVVTEELTIDEKDLIYAFSTEFEGDFPNVVHDVINFIIDNRDIRSLPRKRLLIHAFYK